MRRIWMFAFLMRIHLMTLHEVREETAVCSIQTDKTHSTTIPPSQVSHFLLERLLQFKNTTKRESKYCLNFFMTKLKERRNVVHMLVFQLELIEVNKLQMIFNSLSL